MLNTDELEAATNAVVWPQKATLEQKNAYRAEISALENQWREWLENEYAEDIPAEIQEKIWNSAWSDGHSNGYYSVLNYYTELAEYTKAVIAAVTK